MLAPLPVRMSGPQFKLSGPEHDLKLFMGLYRVITQNGATFLSELNSSVLTKMPRDYTAYPPAGCVSGFLGQVPRVKWAFMSARNPLSPEGFCMMYSPCELQGSHV